MKRIFLTIYVFIAFTALFVVMGVIPLMDHLMTGINLEEERSEFGGIFTLIIHNLESMPESAWHGYLEGLNHSFGYPIRVESDTALNLPEEYQADHAAGLIVATNDEIEVLVMKIPGTAYSLSLGPLPELKYIKLIELLFVAFGFVILAIPIFGWSLLLWRDLSRLEDAARRFGRGDLASRVEGTRFSSLPDLKRAFNSMAERIEKLIASHKDLTNAVSHELRTPLARMRFGMEMLKGETGCDEQGRFIRGIERDVGEIEILVDEMLTHAKLDREPGQVEMASHEVGGWLRHIVSCEGPGRPEVRLEVSVPAEPLEAWFDSQYMSWALRNLIRNAVRHAASQVRVTLSCQGKGVCLTIEDDGPGIPEADRLRIFEPFARLDGSRNRNSGGYGLGLSIAKRIAIAHHGDIAVDNAPLGGARFTLSWPRFASSMINGNARG